MQCCFRAWLDSRVFAIVVGLLLDDAVRGRHDDDGDVLRGARGRDFQYTVMSENVESVLGLSLSRAMVSIVRTDPRGMLALGDCSPSLSM